MYAATLTQKFQIGIPKAFRDDLGLKAGQQFVFVAKGDTIITIPRRAGAQEHLIETYAIRIRAVQLRTFILV